MAREHRSDADDLRVSEVEGTVLGVVARREPITRYQLLRAFHKSPYDSPNRSKGSLYPLVRRLIKRRLLTAERGPGTRETEVVRLTDRGKEALQLWIRTINPATLIGWSPIDIRSISLAELNRDERIKWIAYAKDLLLKKKEEFLAYSAIVSLPYGKLLHESDARVLDEKLQWLDRLLIQVVNEQEPPQRHSFYGWEDKPPS